VPVLEEKIEAHTAAKSSEGVQVFKGLLWREWLAHGNLLIGTLAIWLVCAWVLLIFFHPGFILGLGTLFAFVAGTTFGGAESSEGSEEFSFSLPPTRGERFLARMALGGGFLAIFLLLGNLTIALDLPQILWSLFVNSGFTEPFPPCRPRFLYVLAIALPLCVFAFSFAIAATAESSGLVSMGWLLGGLGAAAIMGLGFLLEWWLWEELNGYVACPALFALGALGLQTGYFAYGRKEGISRPAPLVRPTRWWFWILLLAGLLLLFLLFLWPSAPAPARLYAPTDVISDPALRRFELEKKLDKSSGKKNDGTEER